jgi:hypothetical protein
MPSTSSAAVAAVAGADDSAEVLGVVVVGAAVVGSAVGLLELMGVAPRAAGARSRRGAGLLWPPSVDSSSSIQRSTWPSL